MYMYIVYPYKCICIEFHCDNNNNNRYVKSVYTHFLLFETLFYIYYIGHWTKYAFCFMMWVFGKCVIICDTRVS